MYRLFIETSDWIFSLIKVNLLWCLGVISGGVIGGVMPATVALVAITKKWAEGQRDVNHWTLFWQQYRRSFIESNKMGMAFFLIALVLFLNLRLTFLTPGTFMMVIHYFTLFLLFGLGTCLILFFHLYVHYHYTLRQYLFQSAAFAFANPMMVLFILIGFSLIVWLMIQLPGLIPFFPAALIAYWSSIVCRKHFKVIEQKQIQSQ